MVVRDKDLFVVQHDPNNPEYQDGGDTSRATGILAGFRNNLDQSIIYKHLTKKGFVRHPFQEQHNNPANFSRDQAICLWLGLWGSERKEMARTEFFDRSYFLGVCPNGDFLGPEFYWHFILCSEIKWMYWFAPIGFLAQIAHIYYMTKVAPRQEQNQTICLAKRSGLLWLWAKWHPNWRKSLRDYWGGWRDQGEIAEYLIYQIERDIANSTTQRPGRVG